MNIIRLILKNENLQALLLIIFAYAFSVLARFYWVLWAGGFEQFYFNNQLMIISNDGYAFAEGARDMIAGFHQENDLSYYGSSLSTLTYLLYKFSPFQFESILLYMSTFFSSLIVIPIILIAKEYKVLFMGFMAAIIACIAKSYYNRTMSGYYDTDMLVIVLPMFILYFMIRLILRKDDLMLLALPLCIGIYLWWYPSSYTLNVSLIGLFLIYNFIFHRKEKLFYMAVILSAICLSNIAWFYQSAIIVLLFTFFILKEKYCNFLFLGILGLLTLVFLIFSGGIDPILYQLKFYIFRDDASTSLTQGFVYFNVNLTIQEVESIDLDTFMQRISNNALIFLASFLGFLWLVKEHKSMILSLPMLVLGFLALKGGLRFTIYSVPIMALGFGFLSLKLLNFLKSFNFKTLIQKRLYQLSIFAFCLVVLLISVVIFYKELLEYEFLQNELGINNKLDYTFLSFIFEHELVFSIIVLSFFMFFILEFIYRKKKELFQTCFIVLMLVLSLTYAFKHIYEYKASSVFTQSEALLLDDLWAVAKRDDYVIAWWDYGYGIRYYSDVKTLVDGGKHLGKDNFFPSFVLSKDQISAANMARLSVEYVEKDFKEHYTDILQAMMRDYNQSNVDLFLDSLSDKKFKFKGEKTRDIYIYMPTKMALIFPTIASFSNIDLESGKSMGSFFAPSYVQGSNKGQIYLNNGIILSDDFRYFILDDDIYTINSFVEINSIRQNENNIVSIDKNANFYLFLIKDTSLQARFIIMDKNMYKSAFVQMFFFSNYDNDLYELVMNTKDAKVFKLKD
ncbi:general glycosylation pathway protein [Campylobacter sp. LR291e]|uniref:STT3 domain-containing protein n=1 Tax=unclassified Campylobacter TaxID=2593542 RepID=UPI0012381EFA|nr:MULTISPECIES: STT3 domain-containing protein [unclassified Campylobacter]KAA6227408.1 general glycosylation pathway protein [Campylobacter sp. LR185c]KAA6234266.1 general glycosylation pathway protein [Campylobacter sp. LR291e]KAA6234484.1 general glycosylation pathway protein [Campylobacter sp. LR264d]KAA8604124.1 general glycosylation pathway protein [Campylobacter sp. LR185c]